VFCGFAGVFLMVNLDYEFITAIKSYLRLLNFGIWRLSDFEDNYSNKDQIWMLTLRKKKLDRKFYL